LTLRVIAHPRIVTRGPGSEVNGFLIPLYNRYEGFVPQDRQPEQVYLTVCQPGAQKGPHLHMKRWGYFTCIRGNVRIVARLGGEYAIAYTGVDHGYQTVEVPAGVPALIENIGSEDAYVINTPSPAWRPDDQDDHPVTGWSPPESRRS
jgi:dTDP-4-dehydrorhamnose 3,5-epimerase-like enzyme